MPRQGPYRPEETMSVEEELYASCSPMKSQGFGIERRVEFFERRHCKGAGGEAELPFRLITIDPDQNGNPEHRTSR